MQKLLIEKYNQKIFAQPGRFVYHYYIATKEQIMRSTFTVTYTLHGRTGSLTLHANTEAQACEIVKAEHPGCRIVHVLDYNRY